MTTTPPRTTPDPNNRITLWEILRLWIGGGEYAEHRIPTLLAALLAQHQNESALVGTLTTWLRDNLNDPNKSVVVYYLARVLKYRGGRFAMALSEALEMMPATANELRNHHDVVSITDLNARQQRFGDELARRFTETYEAAKARLAGGSMPDSTSPSIGDRLSTSMAGLGGMLGTLVGNVGEIALVGFRFGMFWIGAGVLYCLLAVLFTMAFPGYMWAIAWLSLIALVGVPAILMMGGAFFGNGGAAVQGAAGSVLAIFSSSILVVAFTLAGLGGVAAGQIIWGTLIMGVIVVVVWDRVVIGLTQKAITIPGVAVRVAGAVMNDGRIDPGEATAIETYTKNSKFLVAISITIAAAFNGVWLLVVLAHTLEHPDTISFPIGVVLIGAMVLLGAAYIRMSLKLGHENDYPGHLGLKSLIAHWGQSLYNSSMVATVGTPIVGLILLLGFFAIGRDRANEWFDLTRETTISGVERSAHIVTDGASRSGDWIEEQVSAPPARTGSSNGSSSGTRVHSGGQKLSCAETRAKFGGDSYCNGLKDIGLGDTYPCNCN